MIKKYFKINLTSPKKILKWTERSLPNGELIGKVTKSETIDYKSLKPISNGIFCEKIFGPIKNNECICKLYKKIRVKKEKNKIIICPNCYVQITESKIRRYRMGVIKLSTITIHSWFFKENPNYISNIILNKKKSYIKKVLLAKYYIIINSKTKGKELKTGGDAILSLLKKLKLKKTNGTSTYQLKKINNSIANKYNKKLTNRIKLLNYMIQAKTKPEWIAIRFLPVLPPELRPIIKLQDNTIITSDLNYLYQNIINTNNRISQLYKMQVSEKFIIVEKIKLQLTINEFITKDTNLKNTLKSLSKILKGKTGRIRENLLGKTVDYSARSVIGVEPKLKISECAIPIEVDKELFQSLIIKKLLQIKVSKNIREAKKIITRESQFILNLINKTIKNMRILLNRAPTLHRIGIQSFKPILTNCKIIKLHPLVCTAFNADFDGDQMGIHIPLSLKAQAEARTLMLSTSNSTLPSTGKPNMTLSQDMVLGCYYLTSENTSIFYLLKKIKYYKNKKECLIEYKKNKISIHSYIWICIKEKKDKIIKINTNKKAKKKRITPGKLIFSTTMNLFL
uniref:DNA-directed RNA polymerase subunit n=1 Tax=Lepocinclis ovum TaxID=86638 RepID=A0A3G3LLY2_9EUGL|nr:RNA polymerase beta' subunit [Lepocinclis ovum]AYQ93717.1 RNA polymerase beta' subunit [Lepocinclis ovum]